MTPSFLLSLDFDGTLCLPDADPTVDPAIHHALARWRSRGAAWLINTGRSLDHAIDGLDEGNFPDPPDFLVTRERDIHARAPGGGWTDFGDWNRQSDDALRHLLHKARGLLREVERFIERETLATYIELPEDPAGVISSNIGEMEHICAYIDPLLPEIPDLRYERNSIYLRFSHRAYSKGTALAHLAASLGLPPTRVFAGGDNHNDMTMLDTAIAAHLACPSNALPGVRRHVASLGGHCAAVPGATGMATALDHLHALVPDQSTP